MAFYGNAINFGALTAKGSPTGSDLLLLGDVAVSGTPLKQATVANVVASGFLPTTEVTGTTQAMSTNNKYILNNAGVVTATLPTTAAIGDLLIVTGKGAGGWTIAQNASGIIHDGANATTTGAGGSLSSTNRYDAVILECIVANNEWSIIGRQGNLAGV